MCLPTTAQKSLMAVCESNYKTYQLLYKSIHENNLHTYKATYKGFFVLLLFASLSERRHPVAFLPLSSSQQNRIRTGGRLGNATLSLQKTSLFFSLITIAYSSVRNHQKVCPAILVGYGIFLLNFSFVKLFSSREAATNIRDQVVLLRKALILHSSSCSEYYLQNWVCKL